MDSTIAFLMFSFFTGLFFTWFFIHKASVKERTLLIEKGIDLSKLSKNRVFPWLKVGIVLFSSSVGLLLAAKLKFFHFDLGALISVIMFGGLGMICAHYTGKSKEQK